MYQFDCGFIFIYSSGLVSFNCGLQLLKWLSDFMYVEPSFRLKWNLSVIQLIINLLVPIEMKYENYQIAIIIEENRLCHIQSKQNISYCIEETCFLHDSVRLPLKIDSS